MPEWGRSWAFCSQFVSFVRKPTAFANCELRILFVVFFYLRHPFNRGSLQLHLPWTQTAKDLHCNIQSGSLVCYPDECFQGWEPLGVSLSKPLQFWRVMRCFCWWFEDTSSWTHIVSWIASSFACTVFTVMTHSTKTIDNVETIMVMETNTICKQEKQINHNCIQNTLPFKTAWMDSPHWSSQLGFWIEGTPRPPRPYESPQRSGS